MNLQVCVPYQKCVYNCPMCIARNHKHNNQFNNLWLENQNEYDDKLEKVIYDYGIKDVIITGECEPTQNMRFIENVISVVECLSNGKIELQTKNYHLDINQLNGLDVLSYSITNVKDYLRSYKFPRLVNKINRIVILLTKEFEFLNKDNFDTMGFEQITFKTLQLTEDDKTNEWIKENTLNDLSKIYEIIDFYNGSNTSIRIDTSCQDSKGRYKIFRCDGNLYENWEDINPKKERGI